MKKSIPSFIAGVLVATVFFSLSVTAMAATGLMKIEVAPINVKIFGQPSKTFAYNGVTYAPLRQVAEACGLEVGYDSVMNVATVEKPGTTSTANKNTSNNVSDNNSNAASFDNLSYEDFKAMWKLDGIETTPPPISYYLYNGDLTKEELVARLNATNRDKLLEFGKQMAIEQERDETRGMIADFFYAEINSANHLWKVQYKKSEIVSNDWYI